MDAAQQRAIVVDPVRLANLTEHQRTILELVTAPMPNGQRRSVKGIAKGLGVSRSAIYKTLRLAGVNLREIAR